jgi:hypothetical protein
VIRVEEQPDGVVYRFPRRTGPVRLCGLVAVLVGLGFPSFAVYGMVDPVQIGKLDVDSLITAAFCVPFFVIGLALLAFGLDLLLGHSEIELRCDQLRSMECCGPLRFSRRHAIGSFRRIVVSTVARGKDEQVVGQPLPDELVVIQAECESANKSTVLAWAYPRAWLEPVANDLARRLNLALGATDANAERPLIKVVQEATYFHEVPQKPNESNVEVEENGDGVTLTVPPGQGGCGTLAVSIIALLWMTPLAAILASGGTVPGGTDLWIGLLVLVGISAGIITINWLLNAGMSKCRTVLAIVGDRLLILQVGIFGSERRGWRRQHIACIRTGPSGRTINRKPVI